MADPSLAITSEYVQCFLAMAGKGISWPNRVMNALSSQDLHPLDVTYVIAHGEVVEAEKETADGTTYVMVGETCDDVQLSVKFHLNGDQMEFRILNVSRI